MVCKGMRPGPGNGKTRCRQFDISDRVCYIAFRPNRLKQGGLQRKEDYMGKGEQTRAMILARVAPLFNQQGYFGSSLSDIMQQTGLEKGGIYNHFKSKEQLALQAFDYSYALLDQRIRTVLAGKKHA